MSPNARKLVPVLLTALSLVIAAAAAYLFYRLSSNYSSSYNAVRLYCFFWFMAALLCIVAGVWVASPIALTAAALGFASFAIICILNPNAVAAMPGLTFAVEIAAPLLFILAWLIIAFSAFRHPSTAVRRAGWVWLTMTLTVLFVFPSYNYGRFVIGKLRAEHLCIASASTVRIVEQLAAYRQTNGDYPVALEAAGVDPALLQLPYRDQRIKYFGGKDTFILTFEDPLQAGSVVYSWDTQHKGWYPVDPREAQHLTPHNLFLGALNPK